MLIGEGDGCVDALLVLIGEGDGWVLSRLVSIGEGGGVNCVVDICSLMVTLSGHSSIGASGGCHGLGGPSGFSSNVITGSNSGAFLPDELPPRN